MTDELSTKVIISDFSNHFKEYEDLSLELMSGIKFLGKSLVDWTDHFLIEIPKEVNPEIIRALFTEISKNLQQISYLLSICSTFNTALSVRRDDEKANIVKAIVSDYSVRGAKRPAASVIEQVAVTKLGDVEAQLLVSRVLREFWKERRDTLLEVRRCLEQVAISYNIEIKYQE